MKRATFRMSVELLREQLHMPASSTVLGMQMDYKNSNTLVVLVEDDEFPESLVMFEVEPTLTRSDDGSVVWEWNLPSSRESE